MPAMAVDDSIVEAMREWGAPPEDIAKAQTLADAAVPDEKPFFIWHDNVPTLDLFLALRTQWVYAGGMTQQRTGLRYEGVHAHLQIHVPRRKHRSLMSDLQAMELAVLQADAELRTLKEE